MRRPAGLTCRINYNNSFFQLMPRISPAALRPLAFVLLLPACCLAAVTWLAARGQTPAPGAVVFRAGTEVVQVDVSVLDGRRRPVRGLTAADFTILEDGQPRPVETFAVVDLPERTRTGETTWASEVPADVVTNRAVQQEGRLVVILMDRTIPVGMPTLTAREIAIAAVNELGAGDMAALISTSGGIPQNFTSDRQRLLRAITQRDWSSGVTAEAQEIDDRIHAGFDEVFTPLTDPRCLCGLCVPETITRVAEALESVQRRRKSLLFIGSDFIVQAGPQAQQGEIGCGQKLEDAREKMFAALDRSGIVVHGVDPSGLNTIGPTSRASSTLRGGDAALARSRAVEQNLQSQNNLHVVPDHTGGRTVMNTNAPQARVPEIVNESQSYYLIGFRPSDPDPTRPVRAIDVRVNRRGVDVRARRQFVMPGTNVEGTASTVGASTAAASALHGLLPDGGVPLDVQLSAFARAGAPRPTVAAVVGIDAFAPAALPADGVLEVDVGAFDAAGRPRASARQTLQLSWPSASGGGPRRVEALTHLDLDPGDYEIRVVVTDAQSSRVASVFSYLTVPAFANVPFSLSSIVIEAGRGTSSVPRDALQDLLPVVPTTKRTFSRAESATAFVRLYQGTGRDSALEPAAVRVQIVDAANTPVRDEVLSLAPSAFDDDRAADCRIALPLRSLVPGEYLLRLEAAVGDRVAGRAVRFRVE